MSKNPATIFEFTEKNGTVQKGIAFASEQKDVFKNMKIVFIRICNDDFTFKVNAEGKKFVTLKRIDQLTHIGFLD